MKKNGRLFLIFCIAITLLPFQASAAAKKGKSATGVTAASLSTERYRYPDEFTAAINDAYSFCQKNDFQSAVEVFLADDFGKSIFAPYISSFPERKDGKEISQSSQDTIQAIKALLLQHQEITAGINAAVEDYNAAYRRGNETQIAQSFSKVRENALKLADLRNKTAAYCQELKKTNDRTTNSLNISGEVTWTLLALKWISGFDGADGSGVLGTLDSQFDYLVNSVYAGSFEKLREDAKKYSAGASKLKISDFEGENTSALSNLKNIESNGLLSQQAVQLYDLYNGLYGTKGFTNHYKLNSSIEFIINVSRQTMELSQQANTFCKELSAASSASIPEDPVKVMREDQDTYSASLVHAANAISEIGKNASAAKNLSWVNAYNSFDESYRLWDDEKSAYLYMCNVLINESTVNATKLWILTANWFVKAGNALVEDNQNTENQLKEQLNDPQKVLSILPEFQESIAKDIGILKKCDSYLDQGYQFRSNFTSQRKDFNTCIEGLNAVSSGLGAIKEQAEANHTAAVVAQNQVTFYYNRAESAFSANDFTQAHSNLDRANDTYSSLMEEFRKDIQVQQQCYKSLTDLRQDFIEKEKPILISEVRKYKNEARTYYYAGEFDRSNALLTKAQARRSEWAKLMDTTLETDDELQRLKEMINTALSIKEGRIIYPEDPLYAEMSQLLSIARRYYNQGTADLDSGNKEEGRKLLNLSKEKLNELKLVYPRNQEASILSLRIDRLLDPSSFDSMFREKVTSLKKINYSVKDAVALESYNDLLDLYEINPSYPELKNTIYNIEIQLGIKQKPVSNTNTQKAQSLAQEAQSILNTAGRDETLLSQAKAKANEALRLNPQNDLAVQVLDEISMRSGSEAAVVLSAADEETYQSAVRDLQTGNVFAAKQKVDSLLLNSSNRKSAKILKLQKRIEASL